MSQSFSTITQRLRQTLYNLETREFTNRVIVKYDSSVTTTYGTFDQAMLQWQSTQKNGQDPVSTAIPYILLQQRGDAGCCETVGVSAHASMYQTTNTTIDNFLSAGRKNFVLTSSDFAASVPVGLQVYYVFGDNNLRILQYLGTSSGAFQQLDEYLIRCESARGYVNFGSFPTTAGQVTLTSSPVYDYGVCKCKYNC